jgi:hypothetical protein
MILGLLTSRIYIVYLPPGPSFLLEPALYSRFAPSRIAAGAVYLARRHDTPDAWTPELEAWSGYSEGDALNMARRIAALAQEPLPLVGSRRLTALMRKWASSKYREVAAMPCLPRLD